MKKLVIKKFKNLESDFTYGLYDGEEELFSSICDNDSEAIKQFSQFDRKKELNDKYGTGNWKIVENIKEE